VDAVIVGIGVNLRRAAFPPEIADRATAIQLETDRDIDSAAVTVEILAALAEECVGGANDRNAAVV
jgi:biotin-(acetyl-CoA carboxylase) ligase